MGAFRETEEREGAETRVRLMESHCEELEGLTDQVREASCEQDRARAPDRTRRRDQVQEGQPGEPGTDAKENIPNEFKERAQRVLQDSTKMAKEGQRKLGNLRARLEFRSFDSEAGSYRGPVTSAVEAAPESRPLSGATKGARLGQAAPLLLHTWWRFYAGGVN